MLPFSIGRTALLSVAFVLPAAVAAASAGPGTVVLAVVYGLAGLAMTAQLTVRSQRKRAHAVVLARRAEHRAGARRSTCRDR
ncbi:hypothetical protein [Acuticoccus sediminis]|uniref:hypothetical protein n=1 Tax=Acuticoccus sediminis TaxID=2184697 RepID=UPI00139131D6|nr:hypothetical protein [Acuticoccus sediminis]